MSDRLFSWFWIAAFVLRSVALVPFIHRRAAVVACFSVGHGPVVCGVLPDGRVMSA